VNRILCAGDLFLLPELFENAIKERLPSHQLEFTNLQTQWPIEPFGEIDGVLEASGTVAELIEKLQGIQIAATHLAPFSAEVFKNAPDLKMIGVCRGGPVNIDLKAATEAGVLISYAPGRNAQAAAEFTIALMMAALRRITRADADLHNGIWRGDFYSYEKTGIEISGSTVGLIGYGAIGKIIARILLAIGARVIVFDPFTDKALTAADGVESVELDYLLKNSSVVSLHARLTPDSRHILNAENLKLLPEGAVIVNSARGELMDYAPLPDLLRTGRIGALALDVYDVEPPPSNWPLLGIENVVLAPHLAGATKQTAWRAANIIGDEIKLYLEGRTPQFVANKEILSSLSLGN
jgi:D-3-phosphoglycerate dehydrogenase / 2-oxoglutarate reductase